MRLLLLLPIALICLSTSPALADGCLKAGGEESVTGTISAGEFEDAAGRPESALILNLSKPTCLTGEDENDQIEATTTVHIFGADDELHKQLQEAVGEEVSVQGMPFGAMTVHHHAPIVMEVSEIDGL